MPSGSGIILLTQVESTGPVLSGVNWNGLSLTAVPGSPVSITGGEIYSYYLVNPSSGPGTLAFTVTSTCNWNVTASVYQNVNTSSPFGTISSSSGDASTFVDNISTTGSNSIIDDFLAYTNGPSTVTALTGNQLFNSMNSGCCDSVFGSYLSTSSSGAHSLSYSNGGGTQNWWSESIELKAGTLCGTPTFTPVATTAIPSATPSPTRTPTSGATSTPVPTSVCSPTVVVGATTSFVSYEAEAGTLGGGATIVAVTTPPNTEYSSPALEASGHAFVQLNNDGQYVQWTNNTGQNISAINLRSCIPDAPGGGGITSTIDLYVNGVFRQAFSVNSLQNYAYEGTTYGSQTDKNPADGDPRDFWNDTHAFVTGAPISPGSTFAFQMDSSNTASFYDIDVVDVENPPAALTQPPNSLSITSYGAVSNNTSIDNTSAINNCFSAAQSMGMIAWIPPGVFSISAINGGLNATGITIEGAGPWYSTIYRVTPAGNTQGIANIITTSSCTVENLSLDCNANSRAGNDNNGAVNSSGSNWVVNNVWIQHVTSSFWCGGNNGIAENCRTLSTWADGGNFNNVQDPRGIGNNLTYTNNFVRGTGDDAMAINSVNYNGSTYYTMMSNITYSNNTAVAPWGGKCLGFYGGVSVTVENNLLQDTSRYMGLGVMRFGVNGSDLLSGTVIGNTVLRCGGNGYNQQQQAMMIGNGGDGQGVGVVENAYIASNTITNALFDAVGFSQGTNNVLQNNIINSPGLNGIAVGNQTLDLGTVTGNNILLNNTVNNLNSGQSAVLAQSGTSFIDYTPTMASSYSSESGTATEACSEGGQDVGTISNGSYTVYNNVNLAGMLTFVARVASAGAGGTIQIRLDSPTGTLIGSCTVPVTGCWQGWTDVNCSLTGASGTHNVYLVDAGGAGNLFNIEWFSFTAFAESAT